MSVEIKTMKMFLLALVATSISACAADGTAGDGLQLSPEIAARHRTVARRSAAEGIVLLQNNGALPLAKGSEIALFGEWKDYKTGGGGSSRVKPSRTVGFAEGLAEAGFTVNPSNRVNAVYVMFRKSGENRDMPRESYSVSGKERAEIAALRKQGFKNIVLIVNGGVLPNIRPLVASGLVDSALFTWYPGQEGCAAIGDILCGDANPSGRLACTVANALEDIPSDSSFMASPDYVPYEEDIYVGYRYFETVPGAKDKVAYPFGHGLSYTEWKIENAECNVEGSRVAAAVRVTNTGKTAGRRSVLYYTSQTGGLAEHPALELRAFAKTRLLEPGESETVAVSFEKSDLASFDDEGWSGKQGSWVIDRGRYTVYAGGSVRDVMEAGSFDVAEAQILCTPGVKSSPDTLARRLRADGSGLARNVDYCGRKGIEWRGKNDYPKETKGELTLFDVAAGKTTMDAFLDQFSLADLLKLTHGHPALAAGGTGSIGGGLDEYGILGAQTCDGPCGVRRALPSTAFPCAALVACSFDKELARDIGRVIGEEAADVDFDLLLAPGLCIHRHPLCGRNFEYFSEDPYVAGAMASAYVQGVQSTGVGATLKHFCCNNRETNRRLASAVVSERALREIYLRGFERAVKEAKPWAIMTSYNHINGLAASAHPGILKGILRDEWGFDGVTMTDWYTSQPMWRELNSGNDVKMSHDLELFTDKSTWRTGLGERNAFAAYTAENAAFVYLYRESVRDSARRVCELVMKSRRFKKRLGEPGRPPAVAEEPAQ